MSTVKKRKMKTLERENRYKPTGAIPCGTKCKLCPDVR